MDWQIKGHEKQIEFLQNALQRGKLAHAYVFAGPTGVGKKTVALKLAEALVSPDPSPGAMRHPLPKGEEQSEKKYFHPDLLEINSDGGIKIEQVRELIYKLSLKPYSAKHKVAIIDRADEMNTESANALLKSLEEPKDFTYIILITSNPNRLPKTILSRCQKITFGPLPGVELPEDEFYKIFNSSDLPDKLVAAYEIADLETIEIKNLLDSWLTRMQGELRRSASKSLFQKITQVALSRRYLDQNVNSKLLLTNLMLNT
jgi:DNA polymerase III delta prime subunit